MTAAKDLLNITAKGGKQMLKYAVILIVLIVLIASYSVWSFNRQAGREIEALFMQPAAESSFIEPDMLNDLPAPVQRWLTYSGVVGREVIQTAYLKQTGEMKLNPDQEKWIKSEAEQSFNAIQPQFIWRVKTSMFGLPVVGRDDYNDGQGKMLIKLVGLIPVVNLGGNQNLSESTMQRYLGEIIWFPTAALSPYITWEPIDDVSALAIMEYAGIKGTATFYFDQNGKPVRVLIPRYRDINDEEPTDWEAEIIEVEQVNGLMIPVKVEASWLPEDEKFTWYRFSVHDVRYNP
jgi:hypothetical protein